MLVLPKHGIEYIVYVDALHNGIGVVFVKSSFRSTTLWGRVLLSIIIINIVRYNTNKKQYKSYGVLKLNTIRISRINNALTKRWL